MKINYYKHDRTRSQFTVSADLARLYTLVCCAGNSEIAKEKLADIAKNATAKITLRRAVEAVMVNEIENEYFLITMNSNERSRKNC